MTQRLHSLRVPEADASVSGATTARQETAHIRVPCDGLDSCLMLGEFGERLFTTLQAPNHELIVVAATSKLRSVERPLEAADFLPVTFVLADNRVLDTQVAAADAALGVS